MTARRGLCAALLIAAGIPHAQAVQQIKSLYTAIDLRSCATVALPDATNTWICEGLPGYPVYVAERDRRTYLSVGTNAEARRAALQTLASPNTLFEDNSTRTTVEWRFIIRDSKPLPYAIIIRYFVTSESGRGEALVVTRVSADEACHVAYIDAAATGNAIMLARQIADEKARAFRCTSEPTIAGKRGKHPL